ncbi:MAG: YibE/F family protein [Solobacterium sp.]|nr:YibE/F family protein [Solobacterium sp.]
MEKTNPQNRLTEYIKREKWGLAVLVCALIIFLAARTALSAGRQESSTGTDIAEYEKGTVTEILSDTSYSDETSDGGWRGEQTLAVTVSSGRYSGESILVNNYIGPLYGVPLQEGDEAVLIINTYGDGSVRATVYEYNRTGALLAAVAAFVLITVLVGGKTGLKSLVSLAVTVAFLFMILIPWLLKGAPTLPAVFLSCLYITAVSFVILGGLHRKTVCAMIATAAGTAFALLFAIAAQKLARIDGLRIADVEPLLQMRQAGIPVSLRGLLSAGIMISALGAVMDVAMSISSSLEEVHAANPEMSAKQLFSSGMNIGADMVGTMTNTLILAFLGSGFTLILYLFSLGLNHYQLFSSAYAAIEVISGIASSAGMILAIPVGAFVSALLLKKEK